MKKLLKLCLSTVFVYGCTTTVSGNITPVTSSSPTSTPTSAVSSEPTVSPSVIATPSSIASDSPTGVNYFQVKSVITQKCTYCHSTTPNSNSGYTSPPERLVLDSDQQIKNNANRIYREVFSGSMPPPGSAVTLTSEETSLINSWYKAGSPIN